MPEDEFTVTSCKESKTDDISYEFASFLVLEDSI